MKWDVVLMDERVDQPPNRFPRSQDQRDISCNKRAYSQGQCQSRDTLLSVNGYQCYDMSCDS